MSRVNTDDNPKVIVCLTGFSKADVEALSQIVGSLGCIYESSLTTRTTHLVCATTNSAKYASAQRAGIICVTREWLDVSDAEGHPVPEVLPFIVPPLYGCVLCPTGLSKAERAVVERECVALGGVFCADLTSSVTHLLAKVSSRSRKYLYALQRRIAIVTPEWLHFAVQTHSHPDETDFGVGKESPTEPDASQMSMSSSDPVDHIVKEGAPKEVGKRAEDDDLPKPLKGCQIAFYGFTTEQRAPLKRLLKELGAENSVPLDCPELTHVVVSSNPDSLKIDYKNPPFVKTAAVVEPRWLVACYQVHSRLNEALFKPPEIHHSSAPFMESMSYEHHPPFMEQHAPGAPQRRISQPVEKTLFSGLLFVLIGFNDEKTQQYRKQVFSHMGFVYDALGDSGTAEQEAKVNYVILPHGYPMEERTRLKTERFTSAQFASTDWLDLCEKTNIVLELSRSPILTPLRFRPPYDTMMDVVLSFSGFGGQDRLIHTTLAHRLGAAVTTTFARRANTHLVASCPSGEKFRAACSWGIPVVSVNWLRQCAQVGDCAPILQYLLSCPPDGRKNGTTGRTRMPRSKSSVVSGNSIPQYWLSFSKNSQQRKHRKSQPAVPDTSASSAAAAEFAPPDTILPSVSGVSSKSAANYLGSVQTQPAVPITASDADAPDSSSSNDESTTTLPKSGKTESKHEDHKSVTTATKDEIKRKKRQVVKLDVTVCSMDDSDLDEDTLELPAAQMSLFLQPPQPTIPRKRCSMGDPIDDPNKIIEGGGITKRLNRESNPECVVTYEHNRLRDFSKDSN